MNNVGPIHSYMRPRGPQTHITEDYVSSPPALIIVDEAGAYWTLGEIFHLHQSPAGEYAFDVLRNGTPSGEVASRIERRNGKVRIFTRKGWKHWTGRTFI